MKNPITKVSDHAVVRYMERVLLVDVDGLRHRIGQVADSAVKQGDPVSPLAVCVTCCAAIP